MNNSMNAIVCVCVCAFVICLAAVLQHLSMELSPKGVSERENVQVARALRLLNFDSPFESPWIVKEYHFAYPLHQSE